MATTTDTTTDTTTTSAAPTRRPGPQDSDRTHALAGTARQVVEVVAGAAGDVGARIPGAAQKTREAFTEADRIVRRGSDETLRLLGAASVGFAVGLLVGGAHRVLILASLIPAALIGSTMVERHENPIGGSAAARRVQGG